MEITKNDLIQSILEQMKEIYPEIPEKRLNNLEKRLQNAISNYQITINYSMISTTEPAPTVLPPSRIENLVPCSIAIG